MQENLEKSARQRTADIESDYDRELERKAKETYRAFAKRVAKTNEDANVSLNYSVHWLYGASSQDARGRHEEAVLASQDTRE